MAEPGLPQIDPSVVLRDEAANDEAAFKIAEANLIGRWQAMSVSVSDSPMRPEAYAAASVHDITCSYFGDSSSEHIGSLTYETVFQILKDKWHSVIEEAFRKGTRFTPITAAQFKAWKAAHDRTTAAPDNSTNMKEDDFMTEDTNNYDRQLLKSMMADTATVLDASVTKTKAQAMVNEAYIMGRERDRRNGVSLRADAKAATAYCTHEVATDYLTAVSAPTDVATYNAASDIVRKAWKRKFTKAYVLGTLDRRKEAWILAL